MVPSMQQLVVDWAVRLVPRSGMKSVAVRVRSSAAHLAPPEVPRSRPVTIVTLVMTTIMDGGTTVIGAAIPVVIIAAIVRRALQCNTGVRRSGSEKLNIVMLPLRRGGSFVFVIWL